MEFTVVYSVIALQVIDCSCFGFIEVFCDVLESHIGSKPYTHCE